MSRLPPSFARIALPVGVVLSVLALVATAARTRLDHRADTGSHARLNIPETTIVRVDRIMARKWSEAGTVPATPASDLELLRRLSLVLLGTIPSLEELRAFESDSQPGRIDRWLERMLNDPRFSDYFSRRLSRVFVGADEGQFVLFRRDRFWAWLSEQIQKDRPYDQIVRDMIAERGLWTGKPEVNFITAALADNNLDVNKLAGRTVRAFLGQRIDCAQCHNHPFADWKQSQFEGLAACFAKVQTSPVGIEDNKKEPYKVLDSKSLQDREVAAAVPFHSEWFTEGQSDRQRLAAWVTHPDNRRFERAIVNRVWGLMFGKPWIEPVDDLPNPVEGDRDPNDLLDVLGADFRENHCSLKRLIATIARTRVFQLTSQHPDFDSVDKAELIERAWAAFPLTRLRPEQIIGSMVQASSLKTIDQDSHWVQRAIRFFNELNFVKEYGDLGDNELGERSGTIPQALLRMNSQFAKDRAEGNLFSSAGRIGAMAPTDDLCLDDCFLVCLTRHATHEERSQLLPQLEGTRGDARNSVVEDLIWSLYNSAEFCWAH